MLHRFIIACSVVVLFMGMSASMAKADGFDPNSPTAVISGAEYDFTYVVGSNTYAWSVPAPVPATSVFAGQSFNLEGVSYTLNQGSSTLGDLEFYSVALGGGFALASYPPVASQTYFANTFGPALYTGPETSPAFDTGTFSLDDIIAGGTGTLTISEVGAIATPEPSTLLLTGIGVLGLFWFARKKRVAPSA